MVNTDNPIEAVLADYVSAVATATAEFQDTLAEASGLVEEICGPDESSPRTDAGPAPRRRRPGIFDDDGPGG